MSRFRDLRSQGAKEIKDLYPTERNTAVSIIANAQQKFAHKMNFGYKERVELENMLRDDFARIMRLDVSFQWDVEAGVNPEDSVFIPIPIINGRLDALEELDHDRYQFEVTQGEADGVAGFTRPGSDGEVTHHEDPKRKNIT